MFRQTPILHRGEALLHATLLVALPPRCVRGTRHSLGIKGRGVYSRRSPRRPPPTAPTTLGRPLPALFRASNQHDHPVTPDSRCSLASIPWTPTLCPGLTCSTCHLHTPPPSSGRYSWRWRGCCHITCRHARAAAADELQLSLIRRRISTIDDISTEPDLLKHAITHHDVHQLFDA